MKRGRKKNVPNRKLVKNAASVGKGFPEIFFSSKELKNVKIHKLISVGKFGKVKFITFFRLFNLTKF